MQNETTAHFPFRRDAAGWAICSARTLTDELKSAGLRHVPIDRSGAKPTGGEIVDAGTGREVVAASATVEQGWQAVAARLMCRPIWSVQAFDMIGLRLFESEVEAKAAARKRSGYVLDEVTA